MLRWVGQISRKFRYNPEFSQKFFIQIVLEIESHCYSMA